MNNGITSEMIDAYKRFAAARDSLDHYGYLGATTGERRRYTRLLNRAMDLAQAGTAGHEDPVFRRRWSALCALA